MEKLKEFKNKHDHLFTKILKVSIFSLVMLAPMFAVLAKCLYTLNPNAKESYYGETINDRETIIEENTNDLKVNNLYYMFNIGKDVDLPYGNNRYSFLLNEFYYEGVKNEQAYSMRFYSFNNSSTYQIIIQDIDNNRVGEYTNNSSSGIAFSINRIIESVNYTDWIPQNTFYTYQYNDFSYIDNVFYYSVDQIGNEQIFSWTKNTGIYGAINTMTSGLGIDPTNNILAVLLTYWTLITAVYVIIDIVLEMFIKITHFIS